MHAEAAYLFRHAVLRDAAYQLQLPGERARLHALAVTVLEDLAAGRADLADIWAEECFTHCTVVASTHDNADVAHEFSNRAFGFAKRAAHYYDQRQRLTDASRFYEIAARHRACPNSERVRCLMRHCAILVMTGPSTSLARIAAELSNCTHGAEDRAEALGLIALAESIDGNTSEALAKTECALAVAGLAPSSEVALRQSLRRASFLLRLGRRTEALAALESCRVHALSQFMTRSYAHWHSVWARVMARECPNEARDAMAVAVAAFKAAGERSGHAAACGELASMEKKLGRIALAENLYQLAIRESVEIGDILHELTFRHNHAAFLMETGRHQIAAPLFEAVIEAGREHGMGRIVVGGALALAECHRLAKRENASADLLWSLRYEPMDALEGERGRYLYFLAGALFASGRHEELAGLGREPMEAIYPSSLEARYNRYFTCAWTASALNKVGRTEEARELATAAMDEAVRLQLVERFHGEQRNPIFGEICAILGVPEPP